MKHKAKIALALALGLGASIAAPSIALADATSTESDPVRGVWYQRAYAKYVTKTNVLSIKDIRSDNMGVKAKWYFSNGDTGEIGNGAGNGTVREKTMGYWAGDNRKIQIRACAYYKQEADRCAPWSTQSAI